MPFVKLDTAILDSTLWVERDCRDLFLTALLMAEPKEFTEAQPQLSVRTMEPTGWVVPAGWYGFVRAAGIGIVRRAGNPDTRAAMEALERLGEPELESRSASFEGRRLIRVEGGFLVLNYMRYRERDYTAVERMRRLRDRKKGADPAQEAGEKPPAPVTPNGYDVTPNAVTVRPNDTHVPPNVTQADADADADAEKSKASARGTRLPAGWEPGQELTAWVIEQRPKWSMEDHRRVIESFRDYWTAKAGKDGAKLDWGATFRNWVRREPESYTRKTEKPFAAMSGQELERAAKDAGIKTVGLNRYEVIAKLNESRGLCP